MHRQDLGCAQPQPVWQHWLSFRWRSAGWAALGAGPKVEVAVRREDELDRTWAEQGGSQPSPTLQVGHCWGACKGVALVVGYGLFLFTFSV